MPDDIEAAYEEWHFTAENLLSEEDENYYKVLIEIQREEIWQKLGAICD